MRPWAGLDELPFWLQIMNNWHVTHNACVRLVRENACEGAADADDPLGYYRYRQQLNSTGGPVVVTGICNQTTPCDVFSRTAGTMGGTMLWPSWVHSTCVSVYSSEWAVSAYFLSFELYVAVILVNMVREQNPQRLAANSASISRFDFRARLSTPRLRLVVFS